VVWYGAFYANDNVGAITKRRSTGTPRRKYAKSYKHIHRRDAASGNAANAERVTTKC